jgi:c-di-AMP phosphodiesterase-like protein
MMIVVDNYEELTQEYKDTERAQLISEVERAIEQYIAAHSGFYTRIERDKYLAVVQERGVARMIEGKFDLLDQVRGVKIGNRMNVTVSIGLGREAANLYESEGMSRQAVDMCLGRGGDQATVKTQNGYEFYGGVSKGIEKRTKVKTRIIASALAELIEVAGNVIIMGHRFADLDALGSSVGMLKAVRAMNKPAHICIDKQKNLVQSRLQRLRAGGYADSDFLSPEEALGHVSHNTLLIIMDVHVPHVVESEPLYRACRNVVVIDHHRKLVGYIENAVIFYHEPYASSASEMVSELIQYFPVRPQITKVEAEALLAGIMLDTKNFVLRTGVRTFEAAAYLRRQGADSSEVRSLFTNSMENYQQKTSLVSNAEVYRGCAIAASEEAFEGVKIVAPQAADELMGISGVDASFVIFLYDGVVNVSARSMGAVNVQVIMEKLGGGGHHTMAAAQFPGGAIENIREQVMQAIDRYRDDQKPKPEPPPVSERPATA